MNIQPGDVLFVWGNSFIDGAIESITHGPSHCAMFLNDKTLIEAQGGRDVGENTLSFFMPKADRLEVWTDPTLTNDERQQMIDYAKTLYGLPYDYFLIPLEALHFETGMDLSWYRENRHFICSTLINQIVKKVNRVWTDSPFPAPINLFDFKKIIKKGVIK
jgi:uncharacterized protein YycO